MDEELSAPAPPGRITVWQPHGPGRLWEVRKAGWTGLAHMWPIGLWAEAREAAGRAAASLWVLVDSSPGQTTSRVGILGCETPPTRPPGGSADWARRVVVFTGDFAGPHLPFLVWGLSARAREAADVRALTGQALGVAPSVVEVHASGPGSGQAGSYSAEADAYLAQMLHMCSVLGLSALFVPGDYAGEPNTWEHPEADGEPPAAARDDDASDLRPAYEPGTDLLHLRSRQASAEAVETPGGGLRVFKGARTRLETAPSFVVSQRMQHARLERTAMTNRGVLQKDGDSLRLAADYEFQSPSAAASVLLGTSAGLVEWVTADNKTSLKDLRAAGVEPLPAAPPRREHSGDDPGGDDDPGGAVQRFRLETDVVGVHAEGANSPGGFTVFAGSTGRLDPDASFWRAHGAPASAARRANLMAMGQIVVEGQTMRLAQDCEFASATEAASVMLGRSADGDRAWKTADGTALGDLRETDMETWPTLAAGEDRSSHGGDL